MRLVVIVRALLPASFVMLRSAVASAQTPIAPPSEPPPAQTTASALPAAPPPRYEEGRRGGRGEEPNDEGRLRLGFDLFAGAGSGNDTSGPTIGATFRIGYQVDRLLGFYGNLRAFVWFGSSERTFEGKALDLSAIGGYQLSPMVSLTPLDWLELAAGPSLDKLTGGDAHTDLETSFSGNVYTGFYFGVHGRIGFHIGGRPRPQTGRRVAFTIGLDVHPTFAEGTTVTLYTLGLGADWY